MPTNNKKSVSTPLHLLQQLSHSLLEHLEKACTQALVDAEELLTKLEKQRVKAQEKLHDARSKLQDAAKAGKAKAQEKAKAAAAELEELLAALKTRQAETRSYIAQLKRDAQESLKLAQGVARSVRLPPRRWTAVLSPSRLRSLRPKPRRSRPRRRRLPSPQPR